MLPVLRKAVADLRSARLQSTLVFAIVLVAATTLYLALTVQHGANDAWERAFEEANGAHIVFGAGPGIDLRRIATIEGVTEASGPDPVVWGRSIVQGVERYQLGLVGVGTEPPTVARPLVRDGRWLSGAGREIVLDRTLASEEGIEVGEQVQIPVGGELIALDVVGLAVDTSRGPYPDWDTTKAWVSTETLGIFAPPQEWGPQFAVRLSDPEATDAFTNAANALYPEEAGFGTDDWHEVRNDVGLWNTIATIFLGVFAFFALLAVAFIIANTIAGRVLAQYRDIGLLKAVGYTPGQVTLVFLAQHLLIGLAATLLGITAGVLLAPLFLYRTADVLNTTEPPAFVAPVAVGVLLGVLVLVSLFTLLPAWRGGRIAPVQAIATGFNPVARHASFVGRAAGWAHLPFAVVTGVKDSFTRKGRALLTIVALLMTVLTFTFALGMDATIQRLVENPSLSGEPYDGNIDLGAVPADEAERIVAGHEEITAYHLRSWTRVAVPGEGETISFGMRGLGPGYEHFPYAISEGRMLAGPGEAVAGLGLYKLLGLEIGDDMTVMLNGQPLTLHMVGRVMETEDQGEVALSTLGTLQAIDPSIEPGEIVMRLAPRTNAEQLDLALTEESGYEFSVEVHDMTAPDEVTTLRGLLLGLSVVLLVIGLVNLLTTSLLNVRERARDYGIFKAAGMTPRQVVVSVVSGVSLLALIAVGVGIPVGLWVTEQMFRQVAENELGADAMLYTPPQWWALALLVPAAVLLSALASALPARRAVRVQVAEVLRYE
jgi:putative ABC transport system permease protein